MGIVVVYHKVGKRIPMLTDNFIENLKNEIGRVNKFIKHFRRVLFIRELFKEITHILQYDFIKSLLGLVVRKNTLFAFQELLEEIRNLDLNSLLGRVNEVCHQISEEWHFIAVLLF